MNTRALPCAFALAVFLQAFAAHSLTPPRSTTARSSTARPRSTAARGPSRTGPLTEADCPLSTRFKGKRPSADACTTPKFFDKSPGLPNAKTAGQVCLGFAGAIDAKLTASRGYCKRLTAQRWTEELNMKFIKCAADGKLGRVVWVTKASGVGKTFPSWENSVTFAEMCYWKSLGKAWPK